jgi:hypothetical protein
MSCEIYLCANNGTGARDARGNFISVQYEIIFISLLLILGL